jgi:tungstate transport system permease protein
MTFFLDSFRSALQLLWSLDKDLLVIISVSLKVSFFSTIISSLIGLPLGLVIALNEFRWKRLLITVLNTLLALPTVVIGLFVYSFLARRGLLGYMGLLYTTRAMIIGQVILIVPIVTTLSLSAVSRIDSRYRKTALTLGADAFQTAFVIIREARFAILASIITAFGRVIAEVGISMMLGGNAKGFTRTMTTAMALEFDKGEFTMSIALGVILLVISFAVNSVFHYFQGKAGE